MAIPTPAQLRNALSTLRSSEIAPLGSMSLDVVAALLVMLVDSGIGSGGGSSSSSVPTGTAGSSSASVLTVQGINGMNAIVVNQQNNAATASITFTGSTTSSTFAIANRLALIQLPSISGAPTLTLQVSLNNGTTWSNTSVTVVADASNSKVVEADALAKVSGAFGLADAFRFVSSTSITSTLTLRSVTQ